MSPNLAEQQGSHMLKGRGPSGLLIVAALTALVVAPAAGRDRGEPTSLLSLSGARVSVVSGNRLVISMDVDGDLPGLLTLTLRRDASGTAVTGGDWVLVVSTRQPATPGVAEGTPDAGAWPALRAGTLSGTIGGGTVRLRGDGGVAEVTGVGLSLEAGSLLFQHVRLGHGVADAADLHDARVSHGTLMLAF